MSAVRELTAPRVMFDFSVSWADTYRALFAGTGLKTTSIDSILVRAAISGRVLLCGRAGSGKSVILRHLARQASEKKHLVVFMDMSRWSPSDASKLSTWLLDSTSCMNFMMSRFSTLRPTTLDLDLVSPRITKVIFLDGLNEMPSGLVVVVLRALDDIVTRLINTQVIVADRFSRRPLREDRWGLARVEPLSQRSIDKALLGLAKQSPNKLPATSQKLFDWPFFLARALEGGGSSGGGAEAVEEFFKLSVHLSDQQMSTVAEASYRAYEASSARTFSAAVFEACCGTEAYRKLIGAWTIESQGDMAHFIHHLHHDFFAARFFAAHRELWGYQGFNALTFQASAYDSIALAFAQVRADDKPTFVREVYDWNPYAIAFALAEPEFRHPDDLGAELEHVILAMLAEKRWDPVIPTAERASDALCLFPPATAGAFALSTSLDALLEQVAGLRSSVDWFNQWKALFCLESDAQVSDDTVAKLADTDSFVGWTLANVLKRLVLDDGRIAKIIDMAGSDRPVVRWRAVHVLGAFPSSSSRTTAFRLLDRDADPWVQYGAIRSLVEMAALANEAEFRNEIVNGLVERKHLIRKTPKLRDEFARALRIRPDRAGSGWLTDALRLLAVFIEESTSVEDLDYWSRAIRQVRADETVDFPGSAGATSGV